MSYYTNYSLAWTKGDCDFDFSGKLEDALVDNAVGDAINADASMSYALERDGGNNQEVKWYEHEVDMKAFSLKFPGVLFTLSGEGEQSGDVWKKYFLDGKMQICRAVFDFPKFDATLLK